MRVFGKILMLALLAFAAGVLTGCGDYGVAAGPSESAKVRFEYSKPGATDTERVDDGIDCGMDYFLGTLVFQFDKSEQIDQCMRAKGYEPDFPSAENQRRIWSIH